MLAESLFLLDDEREEAEDEETAISTDLLPPPMDFCRGIAPFVEVTFDPAELVFARAGKSDLSKKLWTSKFPSVFHMTILVTKLILNQQDKKLNH